jgi:predicted transcriptional regulator
MTIKEEFFKYFDYLVKNCKEPTEIPENVKQFLNVLQETKEKESTGVTDNGKLILQYMQNDDTKPLLKAKDIAEGLGISARTVSGAMRKLVTDNYVEKISTDPIIYSLTEKGKSYKGE